MKYRSEVKNGVRLTIKVDEDGWNPREDWNVSTFICSHNGYLLGDEHDINSDDYSSWEEFLEKGIKKKYNDIVFIKPLYLYDHSGITISDEPFSCRWDSGQVGYVILTKSKIRNNYGVKYVTKKILDKAIKLYKHELKEYDHYLRGECYGFILEEVRHCPECGHETVRAIKPYSHGFLGRDFEANGLKNELGEYSYLLDEVDFDNPE